MILVHCNLIAVAMYSLLVLAYYKKKEKEKLVLSCVLSCVLTFKCEMKNEDCDGVNR